MFGWLTKRESLNLKQRIELKKVNNPISWWSSSKVFFSILNKIYFSYIKYIWYKLIIKMDKFDLDVLEFQLSNVT